MGFYCKDENVAKTVAETIKQLGNPEVMANGFRVQLDHFPFALEFWGRDGKQDICHFKLVEQPNCCGIVVSTDTWVRKEYRSSGIAQSMMYLKEALAKVYGYSCMIATVNLTDNAVEEHILTKFGWKKMDEFINSRTNHLVGIFTKRLNE